MLSGMGLSGPNGAPLPFPSRDNRSLPGGAVVAPSDMMTDGRGGGRSDDQLQVAWGEGCDARSDALSCVALRCAWRGCDVDGALDGGGGCCGTGSAGLVTHAPLLCSSRLKSADRLPRSAAVCCDPVARARRAESGGGER